MWTHWICDTVTGQKLAKVEPSAGSFERKLNSIGGGQHDFVTATVGDGRTAADRRVARHFLLAPWARTLVQCWHDVPQYAGLITGKTPNGDAGTVTVPHFDLRELLKARTTLGTDGYTPTGAGQHVVTNETLESLVGHLLRIAVAGADGTWALPLVLPPTGAAGTQSRTWHDYELPIIEEELTALQVTEGGPDIDLVPRWSAEDRLEWVARVGGLTGPTIDWPLNVPYPKLTGFTFTDDANKQATALYAVGAGSEEDMLVRTGRNLGRAPALERVVSYKQVDQVPVLQAHANADARTFAGVTRQYSFSMQADGEPGLLDLVLGQTHRTYAEDHDWLDDGYQQHRLVGYSGDLTTTIKLQLQPQ